MAIESTKDTTGNYNWDTSITDALNGINNTLPGAVQKFRNSRGVLKGYFKNQVTGGLMQFLYNPEVIDYSRAIRYNEIKAAGNSYPVLVYVGGDAKVYTLNLFLYDRTGENKVSEQLKFIEALAPPLKAYAPFQKPASFILAYGRIADICILESYQVSESLQDLDLNPTMANVSLTVKKVG